MEERLDRSERVRGIEGENDFSGKRFVWLKDAEAAFIRGWVVQEIEGNKLLVQLDDGGVGNTSSTSSRLADSLTATRGRGRDCR